MYSLESVLKRWYFYDFWNSGLKSNRFFLKVSIPFWKARIRNNYSSLSLLLLYFASFISLILYSLNDNIEVDTGIAKARAHMMQFMHLGKGTTHGFSGLYGTDVYSIFDLLFIQLPTCRSCFAASAPALVWNVTKPTGCNTENGITKIRIN